MWRTPHSMMKCYHGVRRMPLWQFVHTTKQLWDLSPDQSGNLVSSMHSCRLRLSQWFQWSNPSFCSYKSYKSVHTRRRRASARRKRVWAFGCGWTSVRFPGTRIRNPRSEVVYIMHADTVLHQSEWSKFCLQFLTEYSNSFIQTLTHYQLFHPGDQVFGLD